MVWFNHSNHSDARGIPASANGLARVGCFLRQHDNCISFSVCHSEARGIPASANGLARVGCFLRQHDIRIIVNRFVILRHEEFLQAQMD
jgi:hypothetical protein